MTLVYVTLLRDDLDLCIKKDVAKAYTFGLLLLKSLHYVGANLAHLRTIHLVYPIVCTVFHSTSDVTASPNTNAASFVLPRPVLFDDYAHEHERKL